MEPGNPKCSVASSAPTSMPNSRALVAATASRAPLRTRSSAKVLSYTTNRMLTICAR